MIHLKDRTRRGLREAIMIPGVLATVVAGILILGEWLGVTV
jgi:hypothetical protein